MWCKKNPVDLKRWNKRCDECKEKGVTKKKSEVEIGQAQPAAVLTDKRGKQVFVDKFGKVVDNPGYDLNNDPRGWKYNGKEKKDQTMV